MSAEVISIIEQISREKGLGREVLIDALTSAVEAAARTKLPQVGELRGEFNEETGEVDIFAEKTVVEEVEDPDLEIALEEAREFSSEVEVGEVVLVKQILENYGRIAAQLAKQVILQKVREAEIDVVYHDFQDKKGELINGIIAFETDDAITLRSIGGVERSVARKDVEQLSSSGLSLMPEALEGLMDHQQMADLLSYLQEYR